MNALDQFKEDDEDLALPPGEEPDQFDDEALAEDPFVDDAPPADERDWEAEAKALGWRDPSKFKPKDGREPVDAKTFVLRGEKNADKRLTMQIEEMSRTMQEMRREQSRREMEARVDGYRRALNAARAEQQRAAKEFDVEAMQHAHRQEMEIITAAQREAAQMRQFQEAERAAQANAPDPVYDSWEEENSWYRNDAELRQAADEAGKVFAAQGLRGRELLDRVGNAMRLAYPTKFSNPRRRAAPQSEANRVRSSSVEALNTMPNDVRAAFTDFWDEHQAEFKTKDHARAYFLKLMKGEN